MMRSRFTARCLDLVGLLGIIGSLVLVIWLQYGLGVTPCPICIIQRGVLGVMGLLFLISVLFKQSVTARCYVQGGVLSLALLGMGLTSWQLWLAVGSHRRMVSCQASVGHYAKLWPRLLAYLQHNTIDCAHQFGNILDLSLAVWLWLCFGALAGLCGWQIRHLKCLSSLQ